MVGSLTAVSGIYIARLVRSDTGGASHIVFVVRDDARASDILFQTAGYHWHPTTSMEARVSIGATSLLSRIQVSYNRPFTTASGKPDSFLFNAEYPMLRWLEANGYDVTYTTGVDADRGGAAP